VKQLEEELASKENEIKKLKEEKINSENPITPPDNNNLNLNKQGSTEDLALILAKEDIRKLNEQIVSLKLEQETTNNKMNKTMEETEDLKKEYQTQIKLLSQANDSLLKEVKSLKTEKSDLEKEITKLQEEIKTQSLTPPPEMVREREILIREKDRLLIEKEHFEAMLNDYKKSKEEAIQQLEESQKKIKELSEDNNQLKEAKLSLESNAGKMALKLTDYKNMVMEMNLRNQVFHVKKAGLISHNEIDIIFYKNKDGVYVMRIDEKNNSDFINILDVESVNQSDKKKNKVDISYMHKSKKFNLSVLVNELVIDQFVDAYKNFYSESMKSQNKVGY
jgi:chromosome segregation ATPase